MWRVNRRQRLEKVKSAWLMAHSKSKKTDDRKQKTEG